MARVPHRLIEGCLIAAHAIESKDVYIFIRGEYLAEYEILQAAVDEARAAMRVVARSGRLAALDVTELFPVRDRDGATTKAALSIVKAALARRGPLQALDWHAVQAGLRSSA